LGYDEKHISQLLTGKAPLTLDDAQRLERVLGSTTQFWINRETKYREYLANFEVLDTGDKLPF
jgi:HTH-type transcriptional regulator/antitoxin HigA